MLLQRRQGWVLTHRQLLLDVRSLDYGDRPHYLRAHRVHLRQIPETDPAQPQRFITELQVGYRLMGMN
ncbi:winged helix-turn-helix domain-containing protein [Pseudomonas sp. L1(2025)]|uniref:winged helix-turn-helix domain-containing protein n=1 Tax=Pseudomonas sp. L1(2025) TaxID=3449429 RepID=UPI003F68D97C